MIYTKLTQFNTIRNYIWQAIHLHPIQKIEAIDDQNKSLTFTVLDGIYFELYKSYKYTIQVTDKAGGGCSVKTILEYEKMNDNVPAPTKYADMATNFYKSIDTHIMNNA